jgi:tRNA pseudouridine38-40 synthase
MKKKVIRLDFSYDGTNYFGLQKQTVHPSVQGEIEKVLQKIYGEEISTIASGRTDTGVHAVHQVMSYKIDSNIPPHGLKKILNSFLPLDIRVNEVTIEKETFNARFSPVSRSYLYVIWNGDVCPPFLNRYVWHVREKINKGKLKKTLQQFVGEHDFMSFSEKTDKDNHVRKIFKIKLKKEKNFYYVYIQGNAFLRRMIRVIIGTSISIATKPFTEVKMIKDILEKKQRSSNPFPTAPPNGLFLYQIEFNAKKKLKERKYFSFFKSFFGLG